jgi:hypothetical protein
MQKTITDKIVATTGDGISIILYIAKKQYKKTENQTPQYIILLFDNFNLIV